MDDVLREVVNEGTGKAIQGLLSTITQMPPPEVIPFMQALVVLAVNLMRDDGRQDEYVRGMLEAALASLAKPPDFTMKDMRVN